MPPNRAAYAGVLFDGDLIDSDMGFAVVFGDIRRIIIGKTDLITDGNGFGVADGGVGQIDERIGFIVTVFLSDAHATGLFVNEFDFASKGGTIELDIGKGGILLRTAAGKYNSADHDGDKCQNECFFTHGDSPQIMLLFYMIDANNANCKKNFCEVCRISDGILCNGAKL